MGEKRILDEATRKKLYGYVPFSTQAKVDFTPEKFSGVPEELRPVFQVRSLRQAEQQQLSINARSYRPDAKPEEGQAVVEKNTKIVKDCILGWSNLYDAATGEEIEFVDGNKDVLPAWIIASILEFVRKISGLYEPEELSLK